MKESYTLEVYRVDKRIKSNSKTVRWGSSKPGLRFISKTDYEDMTIEEVKLVAENKYAKDDKFKTEIHKTYVTRRHLMTGEEYQERYDTPYYCSPSSETYWSM